MRLQVRLTERGQTHQTSFNSLETVARAAVTWHLSWFEQGMIVCSPVVLHEILHNLPESTVDTKLKLFAEVLVAQWALAQRFAFPVLRDTGFAKVVSTWSRNRLSENIQTDGAEELILGQERAGCCHICLKTIEQRVQVWRTFQVWLSCLINVLNIFNE